jgi:hypothetical protein
MLIVATLALGFAPRAERAQEGRERFRQGGARRRCAAGWTE